MIDFSLSTGTRWLAHPTVAEPLPRDFFVRVLHEKELASNLPHTTPASRPEVRQLYPVHFSPFDRSWQILAWRMNPMLSAGNMTAVYDDHLWISNDQGLGSDTDPRANYFEGTHLSSPLPKVECLTCGGNLLHVLGETVAKTNAGLEACYIVETLDYHTVPTLEYINARPWLVTWAVNMGSDGTPRRFSQGQQINGYLPGVRHPLVADHQYTVVIPRWRVIEWQEGEPPEPYRLYL